MLSESLMNKNNQNLDMINTSCIENSCFVYMRHLSCIKKQLMQKPQRRTPGRQSNHYYHFDNHLFTKLDIYFFGFFMEHADI